MTRTSIPTLWNGIRASCALLFWGFETTLTDHQLQANLRRLSIASLSWSQNECRLLDARRLPRSCSEWFGSNHSWKSMGQWNQSCSFRSMWLLCSHQRDYTLTKMVLAFYLILDVAVGGTSGWFPDGSEKPWLDGSASTYISMLAVQMIDHFFSCDGWFLECQEPMVAVLAF